MMLNFEHQYDMVAPEQLGGVSKLHFRNSLKTLLSRAHNPKKYSLNIYKIFHYFVGERQKNRQNNTFIFVKILVTMKLQTYS